MTNNSFPASKSQRQPRRLSYAFDCTALKLLFAGLLLFLNFPLAAKTFNVLDFGAKGDGATLDTAAIQRAIDAAAANGGTVLIPRKHTFLVATLDLKAGIDFRLDGTLLRSEEH